LSSVLDVPIGLIMALALAVATDGGEGQLASGVRAPFVPRAAASATEARADAADPFRFGEQGWLRGVMEHGVAVGLGPYAARVFKTSSGRYYVPDAGERQEIAALRGDIVVAGQVLYRMAKADASALEDRSGRRPHLHELLAAHLLGRDAAEKLARLAVSAPRTPAASAMPALALANPDLFFAGTRPRSAYEVTIELVAATRGEAARAPLIAARAERGAPVAGLRGAQLPPTRQRAVSATEASAARTPAH